MISSSTVFLYYSVNEQKEYRIYEYVSPFSKVYVDRTLEGNHSYDIVISASDAGSSNLEVDLNYTLYLNGTLYESVHLYKFQKDVIGYGEISASRRIRIDIIGNTMLNVTGLKYDGDTWDVTVYQDIPTEIITSIQAMPIILIGVIVSIVIHLCVVVLKSSADKNG